MQELIVQNYNHPSIMFWGLSNEILIGGISERLVENHKNLNALVKEMDSTRLTPGLYFVKKWVFSREQRHFTQMLTSVDSLQGNPGGLFPLKMLQSLRQKKEHNDEGAFNMKRKNETNRVTHTLSLVSPFDDRQDIPTALYIAKKMLGFLFVYGLSAVVGEGIIIGLLAAMGYDPLSGVMPGGYMGQLLPYYGFAVFLLVALLYCKIVEKRTPADLGFDRRWMDYLTGGAAAVGLLGVITAIGWATGALEFQGLAAEVDGIYFLALLAAFVIQSMAEEVICRGFLLKSLSRKTGLPAAVFFSATAFALPHLPSVLSSEARFAVVGVLNLYLVSVVFSLLYLLRGNIYTVSGLHCVWNFLLNGVMGLSVSGSGGNSSALLRFEAKARTLLNGGAYGLEAGVITTAVLGIAAVCLAVEYRKRGMKDEF